MRKLVVLVMVVAALALMAVPALAGPNGVIWSTAVAR